jgi:hypothetical protein
MLKALSNQVSNTPQILAALAAVAFLAFAAGEAAASAGAADKAPARAGAAVQLADWDGHAGHFRPRLAVPRVHHHGAQRHKPHRREAFHGRGRGHKKLHHKRLRHYGGACRPVKVVGWHRGHRALFGQVLCVNRYGQRSYLRGSRYLIRYLYH